MHLDSNSLSAIPTFSSSNVLEFFLACFSCNSKFNLSQGSVGLEE